MNEGLEDELYEEAFLHEPDLPECQWWLLCENQATTQRHHPILGMVPICQRCDEKVEALS